MDGSKTGPLGVDASAMRDPEWDYVFLRGAYPEGSAVPEEKLAEMRQVKGRLLHEHSQGGDGGQWAGKIVFEFFRFLTTDGWF